MLDNYKKKKEELKEVNKEEKAISDSLLPYLKFKTCTTDIKPTDFYDMIVNCSSILDLLETGWLIQFNKSYTSGQNSNNLQELLAKFDKPSYQLGIIGDANKGKSYFISQVCKEKFKEQGVQTPTGMTVSTKGLSVLLFQFEKDRWLNILDSEGFHAPIQYESKKLQKKMKEIELVDQDIKALDNEISKLDPQMKKKITDALRNENQEIQLNEEEKKFEEKLNQLNEIQQQKEQKIQEDNNKRLKRFNDRQVSEKLIQQYILKSSAMILVLVGDLSLSEQRRIESIISSEDSKPIIIVHNLFKVLTYQELTEKVKHNINDCFQVEKQTYVNGLEYYQGIQAIERTVKFREVFHLPFGFQADDDLLNSIKTKSQMEYKQFKEINNLNQKTLEFIKDKIHFYYANLSLLQRRTLTSSLLQHFTENITDYLDLVTDQSNAGYKEAREKFNKVAFTISKVNEKQQLLKSNELIQLHNEKAVNFKYFNFDSINQLVLDQGKSIIQPKYSLFLQTLDKQKRMILYIEMPPVSTADIPRILASTKIIKDNEFYHLQIRNFERTKQKLFELFSIDPNLQLQMAQLQVGDVSRLYKIEGVVDLDVKLCLIRELRINTKLTATNFTVTDGGVVKIAIECEDYFTLDQLEDFKDDNQEKYLN